MKSTEKLFYNTLLKIYTNLTSGVHDLNGTNFIIDLKVIFSVTVLNRGIISTKKIIFSQF